MFFRKPVKEVRVAIEADVLRTLHPNKLVTIIPAPGRGKAIEVISANVQTATGNTALAFTDDLGLVAGGIGTSRAQLIMAAPVINSQFDQWARMVPGDWHGSLIENGAINFGPLVGANLAPNADTDVIVDVMYRVVKG